MSIDDQKSLEILRQILLSESLTKQKDFEKELSELKFRITDKDSKIESFYPIITDLLERKIIESEEEFAQVLSPIMGKSIKKQFNNSKDEIIDALYPIMGQAIKKSVSESIKELYNSINIKIDNALRKGIFSQRIKSKITGVSTSDILLQDSFPFLIKEIFLIHESTGLLISHVSSSEKVKSADGDIISGMLTAIKEFVSESFRSDSGSENLYEIQYGDSKIVLERGLYTYIALVYSGQEPAGFQEKLTNLSNEIHNDFNKKLREFNGDVSKLSKVETKILKFIESFKTVRKDEEKVKPRPVLLYLFFGILGIIFVLISFLTLPDYFRDKSIDKIISVKLGSIPNLQMEKINWTNNSGNFTLSGVVNSVKMKSTIDSVIGTISQIKNCNNQIGVLFVSVAPDSLLNNIRSVIQKMSANKVTCQIIDDQVVLEGFVDLDVDRLDLGYQISKIPGVRIIINNIKVDRVYNFSDEESKNLIKRIKLYFQFEKTEVTKTHIGQLDSIVPYIRRNPNLSIKIKGYSDNIGNKETKLWFAKQRASHVANYLTSQGITSSQFLTENFISDGNESSNPNNQRRVEFELLNSD